MILHDRDTLLFIGDSITACGRQTPVGQGAGLGSGYVSLINAWLEAAYPEIRVHVLNTGIGGNRVTDLEVRWQTDMLDLKPDVLSVMIGINDVWRQFDSAPFLDQVNVGQFEATYRRILDLARPKVRSMILLSPFYLESNREEPMRRMMDQYGEIVRRLAGDYEAHFVDVQAAFDRHMAHRATQSLCGDRVHANLGGHMIIARAFLETIGM
jgi:lysophospholipase L1-like esterase